MLTYDKIVMQLMEEFPQLHVDEIDMDMPHVVFEDSFVPIIKASLNTEHSYVDHIFAFMEEMATSQDEEVRNLLLVSVLEALADDGSVRERAKKNMLEATYSLYQELSFYMKNI